MAFVASRLGAPPFPSWQELAHLSDKPCFLGDNLSGGWEKSLSGWYADGIANLTDSSSVPFAQRRAYDRVGSVSVATMAAPETQSHVFRLTTSKAVTFDSAVILGHNFAKFIPSGGGLTASIWGDDGVSVQRLSDTVEVATNTRLVFSHLYLSSVGKHAYPERITLTRALGSNSCAVFLSLQGTAYVAPERPSLGEFWVGPRRSIRHNPSLPYDERALSSVVSDFQAQSGLTERYVRRKHQASRSISKPIVDDSELDEIISLYRDTDGFTKPLIMLENPASAPAALLMLARTPALSVPMLGPIERSFSIELDEQPPYLNDEA